MISNELLKQKTTTNKKSIYSMKLTARNPSFLSQAAIYTLSNFAVSGVPFLLLPILTRMLDPKDYAIISMFTLVVTVFTIFVGLNIHGSISVRYFDNTTFDMTTYVTSAHYIALMTTTIMCVVVNLFDEYIERYTNIPAFWLYAAVGTAYCQFLIQLLLVMWQVTKKPVQYGLLRVTHAVSDILFSIAIISTIFLSWHGRLSGIIIASIFITILSLYYLKRQGWLTYKLNITYAVDCLKFGIPLLPHSVGAIMLAFSDRFLVNNLLDETITGTYIVAVQLGLVLSIMADALNKAYSPWLMEKLSHNNQIDLHKIVRYTYIYFCIILIIAVLISQVVKTSLIIMVGENFSNSKNILIYIFLGNAFTGMYYMVTNYIFYSRKTYQLSILTVTAGTITLILNWVLIEKFGIKGAAIGFMLGQFILFVGAWVLAANCFKMPWLLTYENSQ